MSNDSSQTASFRCPVQPEQSRASLMVGRRRIPVQMIDTSVDGFTVSVANKYITRIRHGYRWSVTHGGEKTIVHPEWMFNSPSGDVQFGLRRLQDITPMESPSSDRRFLLPKFSMVSISGPAFAGMVMLVLALLCLPGVGDELGTAPLVQSVIRDTFMDLTQSIRRILAS